ncbi:MAG TPA: hypothetical protein VEB21_16440 [Terriglobales bacterium]|nr:hypothetical protein [Terriglobales bacterium]
MAILVEAGSGEVLAADRPDEPVDAGNFGQLLVLLLALERATLEGLPIDAPVSISPAATNEGPIRHSAGQVPLRSDRTYVLSDLMKATLVSGAETAAIGVAEAIAGSVPLCVEAINRRAELLGMERSRFSGLGAVRLGAGDADRASARDLAVLARALVAYPQVLAWSSLKGMPFDQGTVLLRNNNGMLGTVRGVDGLQVSASNGRYGVIATAQRQAMRLIVVVLGASDGDSSYRRAADLLEWGFGRYERVAMVSRGERVKVSVGIESGTLPSIVPVAAEPFSILRQVDQERRFQLRYQIPEILMAPVREGDRVGELIIEEEGRVVAVIPLLSPTDVLPSSLLSIAAAEP